MVISKPLMVIKETVMTIIKLLRVIRETVMTITKPLRVIREVLRTISIPFRTIKSELLASNYGNASHYHLLSESMFLTFSNSTHDGFIDNYLPN